MKKCIIVILVFSSIIYSFGVEKERKEIISNEVVIESIRTFYAVLDEWKNPGFYSPANMFDNDINTCFAENNFEPASSTNKINYIDIRLTFKNPVYVDEIRIMNGFGKNDKYFKNNNRIKKLIVSIPPREAQGTILTLEDKMEIQSFKFDKSYLVRIFSISNDGKNESIYKGDKYDDTCITEIEFYNQGKKIPIKYIKEVKKNYIESIGGFLNFIVSDGKGEYVRNKWKVEDNKLYKYKNDNWILTKYFISSDDTIEIFDENGNCNQVSNVNDHNECSRFGFTKKK